MAKAKKGVFLKRALFLAVPAIIALVLLIRFLNNSKAADLQNLLQNLPKEISQSINSAASNQKSDADLLKQFEALAADIKKKHEEQARQFEKERKALQKQIHELKQVPEQATLREKLVYAFRYDTKRKFPAYIWQIKPNFDSDSEDILVWERNWDDKNPGFVHEITNEDMAETLVRHFYSSIPDVLEAYESLPSKVLKVDFFKYLILLARGGVFADMDTNPLQPVPNWIPENIEPHKIGIIVGVEHDASSPDWRSRYIRRLQFGTWIIQSKPGHPIIREVVAKITEVTLKRKKENNLNTNLRNDLNIMSWTGSGLWTDVIFSYFNDYMRSRILQKITWKEFHGLVKPKLLSDVLVFPSFSFNAPSIVKKDDPNRSLYFITHKGRKSWKTAPKVEGN
mgnify:FL=1